MFVKVLNIPLLSIKKLPIILKLVFRIQFSKQQKQSSWSVLLKKVFLKISQNSEENICARVYFLIKLQGSGVELYY